MSIKIRNIQSKERDKRNFDKDKFLADLFDDGNLLLKIINADNCETACHQYIRDFLDALDKHQPMRELSNKEKKLLQKPWLTSGLLKSISKKRALFKQFKNEKLKNKGSSATYQQYKIYNDNIQ